MQSGTQRSMQQLWHAPGAIMLLVAQLLMSIRDMPIGAFLVVYLQQNGYAAQRISQIVSAAQVAGMVVALFASQLAQRWPSKQLWLAGILIASTNALVFHADVVWIVLGWWVIGGIGASLASISGSSVMTSLGTSAPIGLLSSLFVIGFTVGGVVGNPLAGWLIDTTAYRGYSVYLAGMSALGLLLIWRFIPDTQASLPANRTQLRFDRSLIQQRSVQSILALRGLATINYGMMMVIVPLLLHQLTRDVYLVAAYGSVMLFVSSLAQFVTGRISDRYGARWPTVIAFGVMVVCGVILATGSQSVNVLFVAGIVSNAAAWALLTLMYVWVSDWVEPSQHATVFGWLHAVWNSAMVSGSLIGGWLVAWISGLPFLVTGGLNVLSVIIAWRLYRARVDAGDAQ